MVTRRQIPGDILFDIYSRLPMQSLSQCRFVCKDWRKHWYSFITDPSFVKLHDSRNNHEDPLVLCCTDKQYSNLYLADPCTSLKALDTCLHLLTKKFKIVGSSNGLMCLSNDQSFYICNPITREILKLPKLPPILLPEGFYYCRGQSGFAFDVTTKTYKVVCTGLYDCDYIRTGVYIYTLGCGTWRRVESVPAILCFRPDSSQVFLHGALHWLDDADDNYPYHRRIGAINIATEKVYVIWPPGVGINEILKLAKNVILGTLGGYLTLFYDRVDDQFAVWVLKHYEKERMWTQQYFIRKETLGPLRSVPLKMVTMMKNGSVLLQGGDVLGYYDFEKKEFQQIRIHEIPSHSDQLEAVIHMGSLISPARVAKTCWCWGRCIYSLPTP